MSASLSSPWGGQPVSPYQAVEMTMDSAEVILRYLAHSTGEAFPPLERTTPAIPYDDRDFNRLIGYAAAWNGYHDVWACVKYQQHERDPKADTASFVPRRPDLLLRRRIGAVRRRSFELEFFSTALHLAASNCNRAAIRGTRASSRPLGFLVENENERKPSRGGFQALRGGFSFSLTLLDQGTRPDTQTLRSG